MAEVLLPLISTSISLTFSALVNDDTVFAQVGADVSLSLSVSAHQYPKDTVQAQSIAPGLQFGRNRVYAPFQPKPFHKKAYSAWLGNMYIGNRVTNLSGEKSADGQSFQLSIAGAIDIAESINARIADDLVVYAVWQDARSGNIVSQSEILRGKINKTSMSIGGRSQTMMAYCSAINEPVAIGTTHHAKGVEYYTAGESPQIRLPIQLDYQVGDRVQFAMGEFEIQRINYTINTDAGLMTVSG